jgi:phage terminase large subunit-like protein
MTEGSSMSAEPLSAPPLVGDPKTDPRYAEGRRVVRWIQAHCRYGLGDKFGQPVRLEPFQVSLILRLYELTEDGRRRYRRAYIEVPKGNGKTPLASWVAAYELVNRPAASIPVAAASYDQAGLLYDDLRACVTESPSLVAVLEPMEAEIQVKNGPGRAFRVAAVAGTNDGLRPTAFLADELHEWVGNKERTHLVIENGCAKRHDSFSLSISTPGWDPETLAGRLHDYGLRVNSGDVDDPRFLFVWYGCPADRYDLDDLDGLRNAIRDANPAADSFLDVEAVAARFHQIPRFEFERYHLAQWTAAAEMWLPPGAWDGCVDASRTIPDGSKVALAFDGSYNNDSTAIVVCSIDEKPHLDVVECWQHDGTGDWTVPIADVEETLRQACTRWNVREIAADPFRWARSLQLLAAERLSVVEFPQNPSRMTPATQRFYEAVVNQTITHSGDRRLARHLANAVLKVDARGSRLTKVSKTSERKIDLAVAAVMALDTAARFRPKTVRVFNIGHVRGDADADRQAWLDLGLTEQDLADTNPWREITRARTDTT